MFYICSWKMFSLAPRENLTYVWSWDKLNVYRQSDHGMIPADGKLIHL